MCQLDLHVKHLLQSMFVVCLDMDVAFSQVHRLLG